MFGAPPPGRDERGRLRKLISAARGAVLVAFAMTIGCAEFPSTSSGQYTRLTFTITMNAPIPSPSSLTDPGSYQYYVVMSLFQGAAQPSPPVSQQIAPVITAGGQTGNSINQIFTGNATNVVLYNLGAGGNPDWIYDLQSTPTLNEGGFPLGTVAGTTNDQLPALDSNNNYPATWQFTVFMNQLQPTGPQTYTYITFQVITMNVLAGQSGRYMSALGTAPSAGAFDETIPVPINTSATYNFSQLEPAEGSPSTFPSGGDPALAIQNVSLQVALP